MWKNIDGLSICSLLQGRNPPRPCLQFRNVKSLNSNLKSAPAASVAPVHRASAFRNFLPFHLLKWSDAMLKLWSVSNMQRFLLKKLKDFGKKYTKKQKQTVPRQLFTTSTQILLVWCLEWNSCRTSEPHCCPKVKGTTSTWVIYSFAAQQYIVFVCLFVCWLFQKKTFSIYLFFLCSSFKKWAGFISISLTVFLI